MTPAGPGRLVATALVAAALAATARAHDPGLSSSQCTLGPDGATVQLRFDDRDVLAVLPALDGDADGRLTAAEVAAGGDQWTAFACGCVRLSDDGAPIAMTVVGVRLDAAKDDVIVTLRAPVPTGGALTLAFTAFDELPRGHRHFVAVDTGAGSATALLDRRSAPLRITAAPPSSWRVAAAFMALGIEHVLIGLDHVLFVLALLLAAPGLASAARWITAFTAAHSLTLVLATLDVVRLSAGLVEPGIALSIVVTALANLRRTPPRHRWGVTFAFGLLHGFGFAAVLADLEPARQGGIAAPLLAFNCGVELAQLAIAAVTLPLLFRLRQRPLLAHRLLPCAHVLLAACGGFWLVQRTLLAS